MENERKENEHKLRDECQQWRTRLQEYKETQQTEITTKLRVSYEYHYTYILMVCVGI